MLHLQHAASLHVASHKAAIGPLHINMLVYNAQQRHAIGVSGFKCSRGIGWVRFEGVNAPQQGLEAATLELEGLK